METLRYRLEPRHVAAYQHAVRRRIQHPRESGGWWWQAAYAVALFIVGIAGMMLIDWAFTSFAGRPPELADLFTGFVLGVLVSLVTFWTAYLVQRGRLLRPDGPTLAPHTMSFTPEALTVETAGISNRIAWSAFEGVTVEKEIIVLWLEPGLGISLPDTAFADATGRGDMARNLERRIAEARKSPGA